MNLPSSPSPKALIAVDQTSMGWPVPSFLGDRKGREMDVQSSGRERIDTLGTNEGTKEHLARDSLLLKREQYNACSEEPDRRGRETFRPFLSPPRRLRRWSILTVLSLPIYPV